MTEIIEALDEYMDGLFTDHGCKVYGLCEQVKKGASVAIVTIDKREQVAINDRHDVQWYHRIIDSGSVPSEEDSFGGRIARVQRVKVRTIFASKHKKGDTIKYDFANQLPDSIELEGYRRIDLDENVTMTEKDGQEAVYNQEFGAADYEKHILSWNITAIEHTISFIKCYSPDCSEATAEEVTPTPEPGGGGGEEEESDTLSVGLANTGADAFAAFSANPTQVYWDGPEAFAPGMFIYTNEALTDPVSLEYLYDDRTPEGYWDINDFDGELIEFILF